MSVRRSEESGRGEEGYSGDRPTLLKIASRCSGAASRTRTPARIFLHPAGIARAAPAPTYCGSWKLSPCCTITTPPRRPPHKLRPAHYCPAPEPLPLVALHDPRPPLTLRAHNAS